MVDNQQLWWIFSISVVVTDNREIGCYKIEKILFSLFCEIGM